MLANLKIGINLYVNRNSISFVKDEGKNPKTMKIKMSRIVLFTIK